MTLRLVYVSRSVLPSDAANSVHVMKMAQAFARIGHDVTLLARTGTGMPDLGQLRAAYGVDDSVALHLLQRRWFTRTSPAYLAWALAQARGADVIYTRHVGMARLAVALGRPCVLELHHPAPARILSGLRRAKRPPLLVTITDALRTHLLGLPGMAGGQIIVAQDGADPVAPDTPPALPATDRLRVGYLGSLHPGKGAEIALDLAPLCPFAQFDIVGGTPAQIAPLRARAAPNVTFHGHVSHAATAGFLRSFDVALLPNQDFVGTSGGGGLNISAWTSPLKAFEYMAAGLSVIASDHPNLREVFHHGQNALLVPPADLRAWTNALRRLNDAPALRATLGAQALSDFTARYSWAARARLLSRAMADWPGGDLRPL